MTLSRSSFETAFEELITIRDCIRYCFSQLAKAPVFYGHGTDNSYDEAVQLVLFSLELPWDLPEAMWESRLTLDERLDLSLKLDKRINERVPLPYLTNQAWFCGKPYYVDERVLVPRSPIGEMVEQEFQPWVGDCSPLSILDMCSGSGCIGIACAHQFEGSNVLLTDISEDALAVAEINVQGHGLGDRVSILCSDLFDSFDSGTQSFDLIVSNPPYVDQRDISTMPEEYHSEPEIALGSGIDGLTITKQILRQAGQYLNENGILVLEVGNSWEALEDAYPEFPFTWVDFERGGHGVFVMTAQELNSRSW